MGQHNSSINRRGYRVLPVEDISVKNQPPRVFLTDVLCSKTKNAVIRQTLMKDRLITNFNIEVDLNLWCDEIVFKLKEAANSAQTELTIECVLPVSENRIFEFRGLEATLNGIRDSKLFNQTETDSYLEEVVGRRISIFLRAISAKLGFEFISDSVSNIFDPSDWYSPKCYCIRYPIKDNVLKVYFYWKSN